jgi:hypothetical protein
LYRKQDSRLKQLYRIEIYQSFDNSCLKPCILYLTKVRSLCFLDPSSFYIYSIIYKLARKEKRYLIKISILKNIQSIETESLLVARVACKKGARKSLIILSFFQSLQDKRSSSSSVLYCLQYSSTFLFNRRRIRSILY